MEESTGLGALHLPGLQVSIVGSNILTGPGAVKKAFRFRLDTLGQFPDWQYQPGDSFEVFCENDTEIVEELMCRLKIDCEERVTIRSSDATTKSPFVGLSASVRELFLRRLDISSYPKKAFLRALAEHCQEASDRQLLLYLCSRVGSQAYLELAREYACLPDFLATFPSCQPPLWVVLQHSGALAPRAYSIASSPLCSGTGIIEFIASIDEFTTPEPSPRLRYGVCSKYLWGLCSRRNAGISIMPRPTPHFRLPHSASTPIIMICAGAGIAPFIGFLRHRCELRKSGTPLGPALLFFGFRQRDHDFLCGHELREHLQAGTLSSLYIATSREEPRRYVQDALLMERLSVVGLMLDSQAVLYLCGDEMTMIKGVNDVILSILQEHLGSLEQAQQTHKEWNDQKRIIRDIWV